MRNEPRACRHCGKPFSAKKPWQAFCTSACGDAHRRENEAMGARFREWGKSFVAIQSKLEKIVAGLAAHRPLLGEAVAEVAGLHVELGRLLAIVSGDDRMPANKDSNSHS